MNGTVGGLVHDLSKENQAERKPYQQPRHEPGELDDQAFNDVRRSRQRGGGEEREQAVVHEGEVAHGVDPIGVVPGQEPEEPPEEINGEQRQNRFVPDRDPEISGGGEAPRTPTTRTISPTYSGVPGRWIYAKALSNSK